jgi:hypothetical protein
MVSVEVDQPQNLLTIHYKGGVGKADAERCLEEVRSALAKLQSGFRVLADLTDVESMEIEIVPYIEKIMDLCNAKGVAAVIRVIPDPRRDIGLQIMSYFHYGSGVQIATCVSLAEAAEILRAG